VSAELSRPAAPGDWLPEGEVEAAETKDKDEADDGSAATPVPLKKPSQSVPGSLPLRLAREGESALQTLKRIFAATEKQPRSG
jgi:hypothetical protein